MSFSFRDRSRFGDRYRGKSGDEIINEVKNQIDHDRKMFFEGSPNWNSMQGTGSFSRSGFPFDDEMPRGRQDIRSHLDDLAQRHPEFADQLRCPPWGGEVGSSQGTWGRKRRGSGSYDDDASSSTQSAQQNEQEQNDEPGPLRGRTRYNHLPQYGLRNTVDLGQQQHDNEQEKGARGQRSWSAPPDNRTTDQPQRYVSRIEINPMNPSNNSASDAQGKPPVAPKQQPQQQQQQQHQKSQNKPAHQGSNVRHIPIFVEGRDEPVLPKNVSAVPEQIFSDHVPQQQQQPSFGYSRPSHFTSHHQFQPQQSPASQTTQNKVPKQQEHQQQEHIPEEKHEQQQQPPPPPPPQQAKVPEANDSISRVQVIQKYVDDLQGKVESFVGNSRKDKDYIYLDEMLTRNLLKLDDIETEGKDSVRQARKAVIRNIQRCISILESKVPSPEEQVQPMTEEQPTNMEVPEDKKTEEPPAEPMTVETSEAAQPEQPKDDSAMVPVQDKAESMEKSEGATSMKPTDENKNAPSEMCMEVEPEVSNQTATTEISTETEVSPDKQRAEVQECKQTADSSSVENKSDSSVADNQPEKVDGDCTAANNGENVASNDCSKDVNSTVS